MVSLRTGTEGNLSTPTLFPARRAPALRQIDVASNGTAAQKPVSGAASQILTRGMHAAISEATFGLSPAALANAFFDWWVHFTLAPSKQVDLAQLAIAGAADNLSFAARTAFGSANDPSEHALARDERFRAPDWRAFPFSVYAHTFLSIERWWGAATSNLRGVSRHHDNMANFIVRQILDAVAPSNFIATNPEVLARTRNECGANLLRGYANFIADLTRAQKRPC